MKKNIHLPLRFVAFCFLLLTTTAYAQPEYINKIPIPQLLKATDGVIELDMRVLTHKFNPNGGGDSLNGTGQQGIESWCYNKGGDTSNTYLGPTLFWQTGDSVNIKINNFLPDPTTTHWHGAELPAEFDGGPHQPIESDSSWWIHIIDLDSTSTMWYHPHYHNTTYEQVQSGLSGMIISEQVVDPIRDVVPTTYGVDDIPIIIGDQQTSDTTNGVFQIVTKKSKRPINLVNGVTNPYINLPAHFVRLRVLNGSTRKGIKFGVSDSEIDTTMAAMNNFVLFATDGGYTMKPDTTNILLTGPGARAEILLDLRSYSVGDSLYFRNLKQYVPNHVVGSLYGGPYGNPANQNVYGKGDETAGNSFFKIYIVSDSTAADTTTYVPVDTIPAFTSTWSPEIADTNGNIANYRTKNLTRDGGLFHINGTTYDMMTIDDVICVDTREIWTIYNDTKVSHPFHIHKIFFRVLTAQDENGAYLNLDSLGWNGPKDDVLVPPYWTVRFLGAFDDFPNPIQADLSYMYHCHILTHEDALGGGMMKQFVVTNEYPCQSVGLEDYELINEMILYPNPTTDQLILKGRSDEESRIEIFDIRGNLVKQQYLPIFKGDIPLNITGLSSGFYVVRWNTIYGVVSRKLLLN